MKPIPVTERHEVQDLFTRLSLQAVPEGRYLQEWKGQNVLEVEEPDLLEATDLMPWKTQVLTEQDAKLRLLAIGIGLQGWSSCFFSHFLCILLDILFV